MIVATNPTINKPHCHADFSSPVAAAPATVPTIGSTSIQTNLVVQSGVTQLIGMLQHDETKVITVRLGR